MKQRPTTKSHIIKKTIKVLTKINKVLIKINKVLTNLGAAAAAAIRN
jgi:hypothetical protein